MVDFLFLFRYFSLIAVICSLFGSLLMFCIGTIKTYKAFMAYFFEVFPKEKYAEIGIVDLSTKYLVHAIDAFLFGLVMLIFAFGVFRLLVSDR